MAATFPGGVKVFTTKQAGDQIASAHINDLQDEVVAVETTLGANPFTWQSYTVSWTAATTNPSIGNGTLSGRYVQIGKSVIYSIALVMGSTTTYGSGIWRFSLPKLVANSSVRYIGQWRAYDASTGASYSGVTSLSSGNSGIIIFSRDQGSSTLSNVVPFTWASSDELFVTIVYETE